ncbi:MAG: amidohydrolase family protein [Adlercreutzia sp.]
MPTPTNRLEAGCPRSASPAEALRAYTAGSAAAAQRADELGQLAPGMFADITVLSPNPFKLAPDDLQQAKVQATYVAGKKVYEQ